MKKKITYFNNEERNGIFLLTTIILLFSIFIFFQKRILPSESNISINIHELNEAEPQLVVASFSNRKSSQSIENNKLASTNKIPTKKVQSLQIEKKQPQLVTSISGNQNQKGKSDAKRTGKKFSKPKIFKNTFSKKQKKIEPFNLNSDNVEDWKQIRGIGDGFSSRIIKYKNWLGGFYSVNQLTEVYGLSDSLVQVIIPHLQNTQNFKKIKINEADVKAFGKHPYLEWKDANLIIKYRKHNYPITKDSFKTMMGISKETKTKVLPYLDFSLKENDAVTEDLNEGKSDTKLPVIKDDSVDVKIDSMKTEGNINHVTKTDVSEMD